MCPLDTIIYQAKCEDNLNFYISINNPNISLVITLYFQVLKLYAWEESFMTKITEIRSKELRHLTNSMYLGAAVSFTFICAPFLVRKCFSLFQFKNTGFFDVFCHTRKIVLDTFPDTSQFTLLPVVFTILFSLFGIWSNTLYGLSCLI